MQNILNKSTGKYFAGISTEYGVGILYSEKPIFPVNEPDIVIQLLNVIREDLWVKISNNDTETETEIKNKD
jgi:hypothetical protein